MVDEEKPRNYSSLEYVPVTRRNVPSLIKHAADISGSVHSKVERRAKQVSSVLSRGDEELGVILEYCLREMFRNIFEHSSAKFAWYCGQYWPSKDRVEFAFADIGIGLRESLNRHPSLNIETDGKAIELALQPGITGQPGKSIWSELSGPEYANSGYGLYIASELVRRFGKFSIHSMSRGCSLTCGDTKMIEKYFPGTIVVLSLKPSRIEDADVRALVKSLSRSGEESALKSVLPTVTKASKSSGI